jgi:tetratricopeptide (TPR) repeat protein
VTPGHTDVVREGALAARALGELDAAAELAETCLALGDAPSTFGGAIGAGTFLALGLLASVRSEQGRQDEAEELLEQSLRDHPGYQAAAAALADVRALKVVGSLYSAAASGDFGRLSVLLRDGERIPSGHREAYAGWLSLLAGGTAELGIDGTVVVAGLLDQLLSERRFDAFEQAARLWATSPLPVREQREALATLYLAHGFVDSAVEEWLAAVAEEPDARALFGLSKVALDRGLVEDARNLVEEAVRLDPSHADACALLSKLGGAETAVAIAS